MTILLPAFQAEDSLIDATKEAGSESASVRGFQYSMFLLYLITFFNWKVIVGGCEGYSDASPFRFALSAHVDLHLPAVISVPNGVQRESRMSRMYIVTKKTTRR